MAATGGVCRNDGVPTGEQTPVGISDISEPEKLQLGCGSRVLPGYVNLDLVALPQVDVVHNLETRPWPFPDNRFRKVLAENILEHMVDTVGFMEEVWRIAKPGGTVNIRVPYWNSLHAVGDPTHRQWFQERSLFFFDPRRRECRERPYYSHARFHVVRIDYWRPFLGERGWVQFRNPVCKAILRWFARYLSNIIWALDFELRVIK